MTDRVGFPGSSALASGQSVSATNNNKLPGGKLARQKVTSNSSGTTSTETVMTLTGVTVNTSREIDVHVHCTLRSSAASGVQVKVTMDGTQIGRINDYIQASAQDCAFDVWFTCQPSAGDHDFALITGVSGGGSATVTVIASAETGTDGACRVEVWDSGPSF